LDGEEVTSDFYTEGNSVADFNSLANQAPSKYFFVCTEKTTVAVINAEKEAAFYKRFPRFETICRVEFEKMMGKKADSAEAFANKNPEEKYLHLLKERPDLFNRVPQYQIASYLGVKPETLSRIRKRISIK
jgi:CRP-like cAMP-binding protein